MKYEKKVSICMMVKNEEKNLPRCLKSLLPILNSGLAELIIIDTGSEDKTIEIAKKYTSQVYEHPWRDNFSEIRNISISYAKGEWIWIIDADEEIENPEEMVSLFKRDLSKYNTIIISEKNYLNFPVKGKKEDYNITITKRGFRNTKDFRFEGAVHNQAISKGPALMADVIMGHYGYIWKDKEFAKKKFERTASILEKELKKNPENIYYQFQYAVSWAIIDKTKGLEEMRKAYTLIQRLPVKRRTAYLYVYGIYARIAYQNKKLLETIKICKEGLGYSKDYIDLWFLGGVSFRAINDNEKALEYLNAFLKLMEIFKNTAMFKDPAFTFYHYDNKSKNHALYQISLIMLQKEKYAEALEYAKRLNPSDVKSYIVTEISIKSCDYDILLDYLEEIKDNDQNINSLIKNLERHNLRENKNISLYKKIVEFYNLQSNEKDPYCLLNLLRINLAEGNTLEESILNELINLPYAKLPNFYGDIIYCLIKENIDLSEFEKLGNPENITRLLNYAMEKYNDYYEVILSYICRNDPEEDINKIRYWILLARYVLVAEKLETNEYMDLFESYVDKGIRYIQSIYQPLVLKEQMLYDLKNDEHRFFLLILKAREVRTKNTKKCVDYLRKALQVFPLKKGIEGILEKIKEENIQENDEMVLLKKQFKNNIKVLIENNKIREAEDLIKQYEQIIHGDEDILFYISQINMIKKEKNNNSLLN